jgi:hypothetical protein
MRTIQFFLSSIFVLLLLFGLIMSVSAQGNSAINANIILNDAASCSTLSGTWDSAQNTCSVTDRIALMTGDSLEIANGVGLIARGEVDNEGTILNNGIFFLYGRLDNENEGTFTNNNITAVGEFGRIDNQNIVTNDGLLLNANLISTSGTGANVANNGTIDNLCRGKVEGSLTGNSPINDVNDPACFGQASIKNFLPIVYR